MHCASEGRTAERPLHSRNLLLLSKSRCLLFTTRSQWNKFLRCVTFRSVSSQEDTLPLVFAMANIQSQSTKQGNSFRWTFEGIGLKIDCGQSLLL